MDRLEKYLLHNSININDDDRLLIEQLKCLFINSKGHLKLRTYKN